MALETATPSAQVVGNAFVEQYYHILYNSPELAHRFYHDSSVLSRPDSNGMMTSVTTMQSINEKILSLDYKNYKAEINTADAQKSYKEGVTVLVTGCLTGKDNLKRKFAQSFFLAPQDNGYFVLNDVFRYVEDGESLENQKVNGVYDVPRVPSASEHEPSQGVDPSPTDAATALVEENQNVVEQVAEQVSEPSDKERQLVNEQEALSVSQSHSLSNDIPVVVESTSSAQEVTPKKSYASIVKVPKGSSGPTRVYVPTNSSRVMPRETESQPLLSPARAPPEASAPSSIDFDATESNDIPEEVEGHSIYIKNLPFNVTPAQLDQEFKKFGPIKQGGVQVRNNKQQGYCFGFVEFLSLSSMNDAIQASPITIGDRQAVVEIKRTSTRVGNERGSFLPRRGGFRTDSFSFRGRVNYVGNRGFGRNEYGNRGEFSGRPRGSAWREGRGRGGRSSGRKQISSTSNPIE
ncbi:nuclear transport factor 2-like [Hibiscus syriacus]|uniref:nuclear transport factor 2-like n=1 Tax=Hibiscus syriacus TaxID=106335 RepID=UPI0019219C17|nr:nuclear transport factor 2-like [Hibiscus syriacus]XP_039009274.1 nuclear transport factor 2-like [Hibiscus syriacus]